MKRKMQKPVLVSKIPHPTKVCVWADMPVLVYDRGDFAAMRRDAAYLRRVAAVLDDLPSNPRARVRNP